MLTGDNGILTQAQKAKAVTENAMTNEMARIDEYNNVLNQYANGGYGKENKPETDENGLYTENSTINGEEGSAINPTIPEGFKPVNTETSSWGDGTSAPTKENVNNGLVIEDESENQFVWIPVAIPVTSVEADGTTNKAMAIRQGENYRGLFYDFTSGGSTVQEGCTTTKVADREPDVVTEYDDKYYTYAGYNSLNEMKQSLQSEYDEMMHSIEKYHGFYVGRYELGLDINNSNAPTSKKEGNGVITADNGNLETNMWYGLYNKCKEFAPVKDNKSVVSSMMWGSQYDAMMNWMQSNNIDVTAKPDGINIIKNSSYETGSEAYDIVKNVFDLYGCHNEWTLGASIDCYRIGKGGYRYDGNNNSLVTHMDNWPANPGANGADASTRLTLYVNLNFISSN